MRTQYRTQAVRASVPRRSCQPFALLSTPSCSRCARPCAELSSPVSRWPRDATSPCPRCSAFVLTLSDSMLSSLGSEFKVAVSGPTPTFSNDVEFRVSALWKKFTPTPVSSVCKHGCHHFTNEQLGLSARVRLLATNLHEIPASSVATERAEAPSQAGGTRFQRQRK